MQRKIGENILGFVLLLGDIDEAVYCASHSVGVLQVETFSINCPFVVCFHFGVVFVQHIQGFLHLLAVYHERNALRGVLRRGFGEINDHFFVLRHNDGFARHVLEIISAVKKVHHFFAAQHSGKGEAAEGERDTFTLAVRLEEVELAVTERMHRTVLNQRLQLVGCSQSLHFGAKEFARRRSGRGEEAIDQHFHGNVRDKERSKIGD